MNDFDAKEEIASLKKWVLGKKISLDAPVQDLKSELKESLNPGITVSVETISNWYAHKACLRLLSRQAAGWLDLRRSIDYQFTSIRMLAAFQDNSRYGWIDLYDQAIWLAAAIAFRFDDFAIWLGNRITTSLKTQDGRYKVGVEVPFYLAAPQFFANWRRIRFSIAHHSSQSMGVYQRILDAWRDKTKYECALYESCDYHVQQMRGEEGYREFIGAPHKWLPVEILMIQRIREDQGLPNPLIDHPLMQTPLANPPKQLPEVKDKLLERVIAKAHKELNMPL